MEQVSTFAVRLKEAIGDMTYSELASKIGFSKQAISSYINQVRIPKRPTIEALAKALNVNEAWLMGYDVPKYRARPDFVPVSTVRMIPIIANVYAGVNGIAQMDYQGEEPAYNISNAGTYYYFTVKGNSMSPDIREGDLALVREQSDIESGELAVVIVNGEEGLIKKVQKMQDSLVLISANPSYPPRVFVGNNINEVTIFGRVMEVKRKY